MRVVVYEYVKGGRIAYETSSDGAEYVGDWDGQRQSDAPLCAFVETACEDTEEGVDRLLKALTWLTEEIKKRKAGTVKAAG